MNNIVWGMPTLIELNGIEENISLCRKLNLKFVELNMNLPEYQPNRIDSERYKHLKKHNNIFYTIHLPEELDVTNFNEDIAESYKKVFTDTIRIAKELEIPIINMHMNVGVYFTMPTKRIFLYEKYKAEYLEKIKKFAELAEEELSGTGCKLTIENTGIYNLGYIRMAVDELLKRKDIELTWDVGHDYSSGYKDYDYIMGYQNKLKHMHMHDAIGKKNHLPLFTGELNIMDRMRIAREQDCRCVIETKTVEGLKESVRKLSEQG